MEVSTGGRGSRSCRVARGHLCKSRWFCPSCHQKSVHAKVNRDLEVFTPTDLADEIKQFERAFAGGHDRSEAEEDILRVEAAVQAGRHALESKQVDGSG